MFTVSEGSPEKNYAEKTTNYTSVEDLVSYLNTFQTKEANLKYLTTTGNRTVRKKFELTPDNLVHEINKDTLYLEQTRQNSIKRWFNINKEQ